MATYLITGASRGIGLELTRQLLDLPSTQVSHVFVLSRSLSAPLSALIKASPGRVSHVSASVDDAAGVSAAVETVRTRLGAGAGLDVLVNNAGVIAESPGGMRTVEPAELARLLDVNVVAPHRVIAAFLPLLEAGGQKKVVNISTAAGSIALAPHLTHLPVHAYKVSKAALNMVTAQYAVDLAGAGFTVFAISPGWLKTDMGGDGADLPVEVGVKEVRRIILEAGPAQSGKFFNIHVPGMEQYDGKEIPW